MQCSVSIWTENENIFFSGLPHLLTVCLEVQTATAKVWCVIAIDA
jgi:hypothetical protein